MGKIKKYSLIQRAALLALLFVCLVPLSSLAQTIQLTGTVTDTKGETLMAPVFWKRYNQWLHYRHRR